jgi:hypothetical protein
MAAAWDPSHLTSKGKQTMPNTEYVSTEPTAGGIHGYPMARSTSCPFDPLPFLRALQSETPGCDSGTAAPG